MVQTVKVPPDGGYGWVIVFASAVANLMIIPIMQSFGLLFKDAFIDLGMSATEGSIIINFNASFGMMLGLVNGVLLKIFGYRKMAFLGSFLVFSGITLTSYSTTFMHFIVAYGIITSLGMGLSMSAFNLATNTYFRKRKGAAVGYTMTITGLGPILMPQLITVLLQYQTIGGATLIIAGISAHAFVAAALLQPVKWHMRNEVVDEETDPVKQEETNKSAEDNEDNDIEMPVFGLDSALSASVMTLDQIGPNRKNSIVIRRLSRQVSTAPSCNIIEENVYNSEMSTPIRKKPFWVRFIHRIVIFFDLDLLQDPVYVNIMIGMSLAIFAELNFSVLTAFILNDFGLTTDQSATFMSILGIVDIVFRFISPKIGQVLKQSPRHMYTISLLMLMTTRFSLLISNNYTYLLCASAGLGLAKGIRTVFMTLVIPTYVPLEKLASASGLQSMLNGICVLVGGILIGLVRDATGSYTWCIIIINCVTLTTVLMWSSEWALQWILARNKTEPGPVELHEQKRTLI